MGKNRLNAMMIILLASCLSTFQVCAMDRDEGGNFLTKVWRQVKGKFSASTPQRAPESEEDKLWKKIESGSKTTGNSSTDIYVRTKFTQEFGWSIPSKDAISAMKKFVDEDRVLEVGAGRGLWAHLLRNAGVDILPTDGNPPPTSFCDVEKLGAIEALGKYPDRNVLFLSWWPGESGTQGWGDQKSCNNPTPLFKGNKIIHIGELPGGCTGGRPSHKKWIMEENDVDIPQFSGINDVLTFYVRKPDVWGEESLN